MSQNTVPLQNAFLWLCGYRGDNNFFGRLLNSCRRTYRDDFPHAAGVCTDKTGRFSLTVNLEIFNAKTTAGQICTMVHEAAHLGLRHYERMVRIVGNCNRVDAKFMKYWQLANVAADLAVNDLAVRPLASHPATSKAFLLDFETRTFPEKFDLPRGKSFEEYLEMLLKNKPLQDHIQEKIKAGEMEPPAIFMLPEDPEDGEPTDGKKGGGDTLGNLRSMSNAELERLQVNMQRNATEIVRTAIEQTKKARGTIPGCMEKIIETLLQESKIPWNIILRNHIRSVISSKMVHSIIQPNTALYPAMEDGIEPFPGYNHDFTFRITDASDASGSVTDAEYLTFISELAAIVQQFQGIELRHIGFDHGIQYEKVYTKTSTDSEIVEMIQELRTRHGYGGTDFCAPFKRVLGLDTEKDWTKNYDPKPLSPTDLMVIFTDGEAPVSSKRGGPMPHLKPPCPVIWVITKGGQTDPAMMDIVVKLED